MRFAKFCSMWMTVLLCAASGAGQQPTPATTHSAPAGCTDQVHSTYVLGPDDEITITGLELEEIVNKPVRIDNGGDIILPMVGHVHAAGLTIEQCEAELTKRLSTYIRDPQVAVSIKELRSHPVSVLGAVNNPGVQQVQGHKTLLEMLSLAGGVKQDAGYSIRVTRQVEWGCIPLPNARQDSSGRFSVAQVNLKEIVEAKNPAENIAVMPHDVITVPKAELVYVIGDVKRSGGFVLGEQQHISVLQALALAEGLSSTADARHAKILRLNRDADQRVEIPVDVKNILAGKAEDVPLQGEDILFLPGNTGKKVALRTIEAAIQTGTGLVIWHGH